MISHLGWWAGQGWRWGRERGRLGEQLRKREGLKRKVRVKPQYWVGSLGVAEREREREREIVCYSPTNTNSVTWATHAVVTVMKWGTPFLGDVPLITPLGVSKEIHQRRGHTPTGNWRERERESIKLGNS